MTAKPTDPDPDNTPGLEAGNGVIPGDTPPIEASTSGNAHREPDLPSARTNKLVYVAILAVVLISVLTFIGYALGIGN
jgi:hypothetical protein